MDLHDGPGDGGARDRPEPPGFEARPGASIAAEGTAGTSDHDGSEEYGDTCAGGPGAHDGGDGPPGGTGTMIVDVGGETRQLPARHDYTGDGLPDAAAETPDGRVIVFADTEDNDTGAAGPDGRADEAYVVDKRTGQVLSAARLDPSSGTWMRGMDAEGATAAGSGGSEPTGDPRTGEEEDPAAVGRPDSGTPGDAPDRALRTGSTGGTAGSGTMIVDVGGETRQLPARHDYTGDGLPDAAAETPDGRVIVFADTEDNDTGAAGPDGRADEAYLVDKQTGRVVGAAHVDPRTGEWVEGVAPDGVPAVPADPSPTDGEVDS